MLTLRPHRLPVGGTSGYAWTARDVGLKGSNVDPMTAARRIERVDYGRTDECVGLGPHSLPFEWHAGVSGNEW